jgi:hypothetical protein
MRLMHLEHWLKHAARTCLACLAVIGIVLLFSASARATTKGLSQIVTPDVQPEGQLSVSFQAQDRRIGNPFELQAELGLTKWAEVAVFQGLSPSEQIFGVELGLVQRQPWLVSAGFANWSTRGGGPQPFVETGYYTEHHKFIVGAAYVSPRTEAILGWAYDFNKTWRFQLDFQSGSGNSFTAGVTWNVTDNFQINPALYFTNDRPHHVLGYIVGTYTFPLWRTKERAGK